MLETDTSIHSILLIGSRQKQRVVAVGFKACALLGYFKHNSQTSLINLRQSEQHYVAEGKENTFEFTFVARATNATNR